MNELDMLVAIDALRTTAERLGSPVLVGTKHIAALLRLPVEVVNTRALLEAKTQEDFIHECGN